MTRLEISKKQIQEAQKNKDPKQLELLIQLWINKLPTYKEKAEFVEFTNYLEKNA